MMWPSQLAVTVLKSANLRSMSGTVSSIESIGKGSGRGRRNYGLYKELQN